MKAFSFKISYQFKSANPKKGKFNIGGCRVRNPFTLGVLTVLITS